MKMVEKWFAIASKDLRAAIGMKDIESDNFYNHAAFWCQQSIEKSIKGYLTFHKIRFNKIHSLSKLVVLAKQQSDKLSFLDFDHQRITDFATKHRYPGADIRAVSLRELEDSIELAKNIFKKLSALIFDQELPLEMKDS